MPIEAEFDNTDDFFRKLAPLTEKQIRNSNRLRLPKGIRFELQLQKLEQRKKDTAAYEKVLLAKISEQKKKATKDPLLP